VHPTDKILATPMNLPTPGKKILRAPHVHCKIRLEILMTHWTEHRNNQSKEMCLWTRVSR